MAENNLKPIDIYNKTGISERTITHSLYEEKPLGAKLLRTLHAEYGLSIDWLLSGVGTMFIQKEHGVSDPSAGDYHAGTPTNRSNRDDRLLTFMGDWLTYAPDDEKTWLEMQLKFNLNAYQRFIDNSND